MRTTALVQRDGVAKSKPKKKPALQRQNAAFFYKPVYKPELKSIDTSLTQVITNTTVATNHVALLNGIPELAGAAVSGSMFRVGRKVIIKSVHSNIWLRLTTPPATNDIIVVALIVDKEALASPGLGEIWSPLTVGDTPGTVFSNRNLNNKRFKILYKKIVPVASAVSGLIQAQENNGYWEWHKDFGPQGLPVTFQQAAGGVPSSLADNAIYLVWWGTSSAVGEVTLQHESRCRFYDA